MMRGTVRQTGGGVYRVALDDGRVVDASLRGRLKKSGRAEDRVVIGDRVRVAEADEGAFTIEEVDRRERQVVRRRVGGHRARVLAANVDRLVVVVSPAKPEVRPAVVDRFLVLGESNGLEPVLVVNKVDLPDARERAEELASLYRDIGYRVLPTSAASGSGVDAFRDLICAGTSALVGPSGVGKSSLLNAVEPGLDLRTGELSGKIGRGRHTTVSARMIELECGGLVADTPGFSEVGLWSVDPVDLPACFPELEPYLGRCRFHDCAHLAEPDCAVRTAVDAGEIDPGRYASYRSLRKEEA